MLSKKIIILTLFFLIVLVGITNYWVLSKDNIPSLHDANVCYSYSLGYMQQLKDFKFSRLFQLLLHNINNCPPLYMLIPLPFLYIFGINPDVMAMVNILYFTLLIFSVYKIGNFLGNNLTGFFSAILLCSFPSIIGFSRVTHINIALTSLLALNIFVLLKSNNFYNRRFSLISGLIAGTGMLFSFKYFLYIVGTLLICLVLSFRRDSTF